MIGFWEYWINHPILFLMIPIGIIETLIFLWLKDRELLFFKPQKQVSRITQEEDDKGSPIGQGGIISDAATCCQEYNKAHCYCKIR